MQWERNRQRQRAIETQREKETEKERETEWEKHLVWDHLQYSSGQTHTQFSSGWVRDGAFTSASWTRLESAVQCHHHFKCVICLRHFQTTDLCSRHQTTHSGTWAALSPALELSWASLTTVPEPTSEMQCPVPSLEISPRINGPNISHRAANHSSFHDSLIFKLKKRCQILPNKTVLLTD